MDFPDGPVIKNRPSSAEDVGSVLARELRSHLPHNMARKKNLFFFLLIFEKKWFAKFPAGDFSLYSAPWSGRPVVEMETLIENSQAWLC